MEKIAWLIDSASDIKPEMIKNEDVYIMPLLVNINGEIYRDGIDIKLPQFYEKLKEDGVEMKTSQPSAGEFVEMFAMLKENYDRCIAVLVSSALSGTYNSCHIASEMVDFPVDIVDTGFASVPMVFILNEGIRLQQEGRSLEEILSGMREMPSKIRAYVLVKDLERLHKGGRLNAAQFLMGNLLQVKPVLHFVDKMLVSFEKIRGFNKAKRRITELYAEDANAGKEINACIVHSDLDEATGWKEELESLNSNVTIQLCQLGPTIGVHTGTGTIGLVWHHKN